LREDCFRFPVMHLLRWGVSALVISRCDEGVVLCSLCLVSWGVVTEWPRCFAVGGAARGR
jgi:hypothetical protein